MESLILSLRFVFVEAHDICFMTAFLVSKMGFPHLSLEAWLRKFLTLFTNFYLKDLCWLVVRLELVLTAYAQHLVTLEVYV